MRILFVAILTLAAALGQAAATFDCCSAGGDEEAEFPGRQVVGRRDGRDSSGAVVFRAFATISYDDLTSKYVFRAYNDGRYLDTELQVTPGGFVWGYTAGPAKISNIMRLNEKGEWAETTEATIGSTPARKTLEMALRRQP